jgi:broad specificity phosphatase PhoE
MPTKLLLVRHGETLDNRRRVFQGQIGSGLTDLGREQSRLLAARLALLARVGVRFGAMYTSDLERARETADVLGRALDLTLEVDAGLREIYLGGWQGLHETEVIARFRDEWEAWRRGEDIARGGGERLAEVGARMVRTVERIAALHPDGNVIVVSHGAAIKSFAAHVLDTTALRLRALRPVSNTGASLFERGDDGAYGLVLYNETSHFEDALAAALSAPNLPA